VKAKNRRNGRLLDIVVSRRVGRRCGRGGSARSRDKASVAAGGEEMWVGMVGVLGDGGEVAVKGNEEVVMWAVYVVRGGWCVVGEER